MDEHELLELARTAVGQRWSTDPAISKEDLIQEALWGISKTPPEKSNGWKVLTGRAHVRRLIHSKQSKSRKSQTRLPRGYDKAKNDENKWFWEWIEELPELLDSQRYILKATAAGMTLEEISKKVGLSNSSVYKQKIKAIDIITKYI
jgi:DNA-directed RNA polymerase specialized sigma24 family protein